MKLLYYSNSPKDHQVNLANIPYILKKESTPKKRKAKSGLIVTLSNNKSKDKLESSTIVENRTKHYHSKKTLPIIKKEPSNNGNDIIQYTDEYNNTTEYILYPASNNFNSATIAIAYVATTTTTKTKPKLVFLYSIRKPTTKKADPTLDTTTTKEDTNKEEATPIKRYSTRTTISKKGKGKEKA